MPEPSAEETAQRLRAMWGWSGQDQTAFLQAIGLDPKTGKNYLRRKRPQRATTETLARAAELAGLPQSFALLGAAAITPDEPGMGERLEALERKVDALIQAAQGARDPGTGGPLDYTRVSTDEGRLATGAALGTAGVGESKPPAQTARDEAGATAEEPQVPREETPRTEPGAAG